MQPFEPLFTALSLKSSSELPGARGDLDFLISPSSIADPINQYKNRLQVSFWRSRYGGFCGMLKKYREK
jgi:hypothetical protein